MKSIYMDYQATTPVDPRVLETMLPYFSQHFGNAASRNHEHGWEAEKVVDLARETISKAIGAANPSEIIFTSGATESDNLAILGLARMYQKKGRHIITVKTEHKAVLDACAQWEYEGGKVTYLDVDKKGFIRLEELESAIQDDTVLVSVMHANNEIGVLQPIEKIGAITRKKGIFFHTDATQSLGKIPIDVEAMGIDLLSMSAHKIYGPKGIGALYVRKRKPRVRLTPLIHGGGHERGMRSGTLNVPGIVGLAKAIELCCDNMQEQQARIRKLRNRLYKGLKKELDELYLNGDMERSLPGNLNLSFAYVEGESLMMGIKEISVSSGSACTSASLEPSYVLRALDIGDDLAHSSIRFSIGRFTTEEEIDYVIKRVVEEVTKLRDMSPLYEMVKEGVDLSKINWTAH